MVQRNKSIRCVQKSHVPRSKHCRVALLFQCFTDRKADDATQARVPFLRLAKERRFEEIRNILSVEDAYSNWFNVVFRQIDAKAPNRISKQETLHALCMYQPDVETVQLVLERLRQLVASPENGTGNLRNNIDVVMAQDVYGRTALHVAAASNCNVDVVSLLLKSSGAAMALDRDKRFALHWACVKAASVRKEKSKKASENIVLLVNCLIQAYPLATLSKDLQGSTPLDLAADADPRIKSSLGFVSKLLPNHDQKSFASKRSVGTRSTVEIPMEVEYDSDDDVSSVGSRGVSRHVRHCVDPLQQKQNLVFI